MPSLIKIVEVNSLSYFKTFYKPKPTHTVFAQYGSYKMQTIGCALCGAAQPEFETVCG